jgi:glycolate oxidase
MRTMEDRKKKIFKELAKIVGEEYVSIDKEDLVPYSRDVISKALKLYSADYVVAPGNVEEVQHVVKVANKYKVNLYPYAFGTSISAAALPREGGMMMVLRRMNRILKIDVDKRTATVEPGVTWSKLFFETKKFGLHPLGVGGGPNTGGLVGNFALGGGNMVRLSSCIGKYGEDYPLLRNFYRWLTKYLHQSSSDTRRSIFRWSI